MTDAKIEELIEQTSLETMRKKAVESVKDAAEKSFMERFFRKGKVGDSKKYFNEEQMEKWRQVIQEELKGTDIKIDI